MTAQTWFEIGTVPLIAAGAGHALLAVADSLRPRWFAPIDRAVLPAVDGTGIRLVGRPRPSMWRVWLGIHVSHGLGVCAFGLLCLLIASHDFALVGEIPALRVLTVACAAIWLVLALRFWFWGPVLICGTATACFTVSALLA